MTQRLIVTAILLAGGITLGYLAGTWKTPGGSSPVVNSASHDHDHDHEHDHDSDHGDDGNQLVLSDQARRNLKLKIGPVSRSDFWRTIVLPGTIAEQPGQSERRITTAVNGIVTRVDVAPGQTVRPGDALVEIQTTGELLANAQSNLLKTIQDLELVNVELKRLEPLAEQGSIPGSRVLEKQYERQRLETQRLVQVQELLVRGLEPEQVRQIMETKVLLRNFTIRVPRSDSQFPGVDSAQADILKVLPIQNEVADTAPARIYSVEQLDVFPGKLLQPGDELCSLALHTDLRIVGKAFQKEAEWINEAIEEQRPVTVFSEASGGTPLLREGLTIQYADNVVDPETRLLRFYLPLKNEVIRDLTNRDGVTFRAWRFKPGQRVQLRIPVEHWTNKIVLPIDAVVKEGAEAYVFRENGQLLERVTVTLLYEDTRFAVLADDGSLFPDDPIALNDAYQLNLALRKAQGSGVDLHAGHSH